MPVELKSLNCDQYRDIRFKPELSLWRKEGLPFESQFFQVVHIPVPDETNDNIVAYWVADPPLQPDAPRDFEYRLHWQKNTEAKPPDAWVVQTRRGHIANRVENPDGSIGFVVNFDGPALHKLGANAKPESSVSADTTGQIAESGISRNDINGGWRLTMRVHRIDNTKPLEIRAQLHGKDNKESEIWSYILPPE